MARFRYVGDDERVFPHVSLTVAPDDVIEADENPNPRYFVADDSAEADTDADPSED